MTTLIACSHGTGDERGRATVRLLIDQVRLELPDVRVVAAFVDVESPDVASVVRAEVARDEVVVVPLLLSAGFHTAVDIARAVASFPQAVQSAPLGTHPLVADVLAERVTDAAAGRLLPDDHVVLAAAGSSNPAAEGDVRAVATRLRTLISVNVSIGYASASTPRIADAVRSARSAGARRVIAASHVLAPGYFAGLVHRAGADLVTPTLAPDPRIAVVVRDRYRAGVDALGSAVSRH